MVKEMRNKLGASKHVNLGDKGDDVGEILRFLRARDNNVNKAFEMYSAHLDWWEAFKPSELDPETFQEELKIRKLRLLPPDREGHPTIVFCAAKHVAGVRPQEETLRYLVWTVINAVHLLPPGEEKFNVIYYRRGFSRKNMDRSLLTAVAHLLEANFPERVHLILVYSADWLFALLYKIVRPFLPTATVKKIRILEKSSDLREAMLKWYDEDSLWHRHGGRWHDAAENTSEDEEEEGSADNQEERDRDESSEPKGVIASSSEGEGFESAEERED